MLSVSSAASRHLLRQQPTSSAAAAAHLRRAGGGSNYHVASARRHFGLRRTQTKGRRGPAIPRLPSKQQTSSSTTSGGAAAPPPPSAAAQQQQQQQFRTTDPHSIANEMVSASSSSKRTPGTESVASLTNEQKLSNYAMAGGLLAFVSYVFYYSLASVGGENKARSLLFGEQKSEGDANVTPGFEDFLKEANEGRTLEEERAMEERRARGDARELVELEESTAARLRSEGLGEDIVASAGSASEEEEREMARIAGFVDGGDSPEGGGGVAIARRPLWKRVVYFWRRE
jgi:hypothetical protein